MATEKFEPNENQRHFHVPGAPPPGHDLRDDKFPHIMDGKEISARPPSVTIAKSPEFVYGYLRDFSNFPKFMKHVQEVRLVTDGVYHWVCVDKSGDKHEWDTEIVAEKLGEMFAWQTLTEVDEDRKASAFTLERASGGRGTIVSLRLAHESFMEQLTGSLAKLVGKNPNLKAATDLRRLKALLETGEIPTIEGQPSGREAGAQTLNQ